ncbi:MAG: hypothetical protein U1F43_09935 [Myxococcota bacterium]
MRRRISPASPVWAFLLAALAPAACGDSGSATDAGADAPDANDASDASDASPDGADASDGVCAPTPGDSGPRFAQTDDRFELALSAGYVQLRGRVLDGAVVAFHTEAERQGQCRLLRYQATLCDPACEPDQRCVASTCVADPGLLSAGRVTLAGVQATAIAVEPSAIDDYFWDAEGSFAPGLIELSAAGDAVGAFALEACPVEAPAPAADWSAALDARGAGADAVLAWTDAVPGARIYLRMTTGIATHGGISPVEVECEGPDTGSLTLPGAYLDALYAQGWGCGECGDNALYRYRAAETTASGHTLQLRVQSAAHFYHIGRNGH